MPRPRKGDEARTERQELRIEPSRKRRWIEAARAEGLSLCDWIIEAAEARLTQGPSEPNSGSGAPA